MCDQNHLRRLRSNGFCVVESVIPGDAIDLIRDDVTAAVFAHRRGRKSKCPRFDPAVTESGHREPVFRCKSSTRPKALPLT